MGARGPRGIPPLQPRFTSREHSVPAEKLCFLRVQRKVSFHAVHTFFVEKWGYGDFDAYLMVKISSSVNVTYAKKEQLCGQQKGDDLIGRNAHGSK